MGETRSQLTRLPQTALGLTPRLVLFGTGVLFGAVSLVVYDVNGYSRGMLIVWLVGLLTMGLYCWKESAALPRISLGDVVAAGALVLVFTPLYIAHLYNWPVQVISDEPTIMGVSQDYSHTAGVDPFGVSTYQTRPALLFLAWGHAGRLIGGLDLYHMRLLHALVGLLAIGLSYALFRQLLPRPWALFASCLFGLNHAYLMISRLAMRENTAVLAEVVALALLLYGLRRGHLFLTYLGGIAAGLGFYTYHPGRAALPVWVVFLVLVGLLYRRQFPWRKVGRFGAIAVAGFVIMAGPLLIAESKAPRISREVDPTAQLLITKRGLELQRDWVFAHSILKGYLKNVEYGLTTFNSNVVDHGWIYVNPGHGFVDPLTGILLWIGVGVVGFRFRRRRDSTEPWPLLMLSSFLLLWVAFAFLINQAPKYPRLLITLPFVAYLVTEAVRWLVGRWRTVPYARLALPAAVLAAVAVWNIAIAWDFVDRGRREGEPIGSTGRYMAAHPKQDFFLVADENGRYRYFPWGNPGWWQNWMDKLAPEATLRDIATAAELNTLHPQPPFSFLMSGDLLNATKPDLVARYPQARVRAVIPSGKLVAFEVQ